MTLRPALFLLAPAFFSLYCFAQYAIVQPAHRASLPQVIDGNTSAMWADGELHIFHSTGVPTRSKGPDQFHLGGTENIDFNSSDHKPVWFEAVWRDPDGTLFLWYHNEPGGVCSGNKLTAPRIGAAVSHDNGKTVEDLGIVLESGDPVDCDAENGFFAGGHGDFSVVPDQEGQFFYFFFTNYAGAADEQGVATARMPMDARYNPAGAVQKYYRGEWNQPGLGGHMTAIFPASVSWQESNTDSYWGPSVHWNTYLQQYVMLMNRSCCKPGWPQMGVFASYSVDLSHPETWVYPWWILDSSQISHAPGYYPQVLGLEEGGTDSVAGQVARLYVHGDSDFEIIFFRDTPVLTPNDPCDSDSGQFCPEAAPARRPAPVVP